MAEQLLKPWQPPTETVQEIDATGRVVTRAVPMSVSFAGRPFAERVTDPNVKATRIPSKPDPGDVFDNAAEIEDDDDVIE